jgi:transmembrane sensor
MSELQKSMDPVKAAIAWEVHLRSGEVTAEDRSDFNAWRAASPANENAWNALQTKLKPVQTLASRHPAAGREALLTSDESRRRALRAGLGGTLGLAACAFFGYRVVHQFGYDAQFRTGTAQQESIALNSNIGALLEAGTSVYAQSGLQEASWRINSGRMLIDALHNQQLFSVMSDQGRVQARNARFSIGVFDTDTVVAMDQGHGILTLRDGATRPIAQGEVVSFSAATVERVSESISAAMAWTSGLLVASDESVGDVVSVLRRYRHGVIRVSSDAAQRHVSGVFSLKDPNGALQQLADSLSLKIQTYGNFLVLISDA